jgi:hypothetical protein
MRPLICAVQSPIDAVRFSGIIRGSISEKEPSSISGVESVEKRDVSHAS